MAEDTTRAHQLFHGISFTILPSDHLRDDEIREIKDKLEENGATYLPPLSGPRIDDVAQHSHIISTHVDFPDYASALEHNCHVVKPSWVYQSLLKGRQAQTRQHSPDPVLIFRDIVLTCADLPEGDQDAIIAGTIAMGGMHSEQMTKLVTHVVSLTEEHDKVRVVRQKKLDCSVVLPHWFDDCLKLGRKISEKPYLLPNPEITNSEAQGPTRQHQYPDIRGATSAVAGHPPDTKTPTSSPASPSTPRKRLNVFNGQKIFFSRDLNINERLSRTLEELVERGGGSVTVQIDDCDIYVGQFRDGREYVTASRAGKQVANLSWFYNVLTRNRWTNPRSKLLHYPIPRNGIPGFDKMKISLSNYTGEARLYLENLAKVAGSEFTRTMKQDNTHLITAHRSSEKCEAAQEWNINIVNHLWLEDSYAKCQPQSLTNTRYTTFPPRTNLSEIVGQTSIDIGRVEQKYFKNDDKTSKDVFRDGLKEEKVAHRANGSALVRPSPRKTVPASSLPASNVPVNDQDNAADEESEEEEAGTPVPIKEKKRSRKVSDTHRTPSAIRSLSEKENQEPPSTGSNKRLSAMKAASTLQIQCADANQYAKESKRKGGVIHGRKRTSDEAHTDEELGLNDDQEKGAGAQRQTKKPRSTQSAPSESVPVKYKMLISGDDRWSQNAKKENEDKKTLRSLGIQLVTNPSECNLLCAPRLLRTRKFIVAMANAPQVVATTYLDYALRHHMLPDPVAYYLRDKDAEEKYAINLGDSILRASDNCHRLLRGWTIYVTDKVTGGYETYKEIIETNGGTAIPYRGRTGVVVLPRRRLRIDQDPDAGLESQNQGGDGETGFVYLVSGIEEEEVRIWSTFRKLAEKQGLETRIVKTDWVLNLAMAQRVEWDEKWELREGDLPAAGGERRK